MDIVEIQKKIDKIYDEFVKSQSPIKEEEE